MSKINSKKKGSRGELELANYINDRTNLTVRRTAQYNGKELGSLADVVGVPNYHIEVKRVERLNITEAYKQAVRDNHDIDTPIVAHRKNNEEWLVTMSLDDFIKINLKEYTNELD